MPDTTYSNDETDKLINIDNISLEELIKLSDIIAIGTTKEFAPGIVIGKGDGVPTTFSECTLQIEKMLKGDNAIKTVSIAMKPLVVIGKNWDRWESPICRVTDSGIWFLSKNPITVPKRVINFIRDKGEYYFIYKRQDPDEKLINTILDR